MPYTGLTQTRFLISLVTFCGLLDLRTGYNNSLQVEDALKFPDYATLERLVHRRSIKNYNTDSSRILKTSYMYISSLVGTMSILSFMRNVSQDYYRY